MKPSLSRLRLSLATAAALGLVLALVAFASPVAASSATESFATVTVEPVIDSVADLEALVTPAPESMACMRIIPVANDDSGFVAYPVMPSVTIDLLANDAAGVALAYVGQPSLGTVQVVGPGTVRYTAQSWSINGDSFVYGVRGCLQCFGGWCSEPDLDSATVHIEIQLIE